MLTTTDIIFAVLIALSLREILVVGLDWLVNTIENRRFRKELDELFEELEEAQARAKHPAGRKRAVKKAVKKR